MSDTLRESITRLKQLSPELNAVTDEAGELVRTVETFLNDECRFHIPASAVLRGLENEHGCADCLSLSYERYEGKFRLVVDKYWTDPSDEPHSLSTTPWVDCPRDVKLSTVALIPLLLRNIATRVEATIAEFRTTARTVRESLALFGVTNAEGKR